MVEKFAGDNGDCSLFWEYYSRMFYVGCNFGNQSVSLCRAS